MGTFSAMLCRREVTFMFLGLTIGALVVSAQREVPEEFQKCVTTCIDANGQVLTSGNYPDCDQCNDFVQCFSGNKAIQHCPLGTNYFNRKLGVCDSDIKVCVNDSLSTTTITSTRETTTSTTQETTTSSTVASVTAAQVPNITAIITTTQTTTITSLPTTMASTAKTPTSTISTLTTATITTTALPTTTTTALPATTTVTLVTATSTNPAVTASTNSTGFMPRSGAEADSFWFAIDFYNKNSLETVRAGVQSVDSLTAEDDQGATYYRIYGVTLVQTACPNKPEFAKADYTKCPLMTPPPGNRNQYFVAKCGYKVRYTPATSTGPVKLDMIYMMCSK